MHISNLKCKCMKPMEKRLLTSGVASAIIKWVVVGIYIIIFASYLTNLYVEGLPLLLTLQTVYRFGVLASPSRSVNL